MDGTYPPIFTAVKLTLNGLSKHFGPFDQQWGEKICVTRLDDLFGWLKAPSGEEHAKFSCTYQATHGMQHAPWAGDFVFSSFFEKIKKHQSPQVAKMTEIEPFPILGCCYFLPFF